MKGVVLVIGVLQATVLLDLRRIGQVNRIALGAQTIDQPIQLKVDSTAIDCSRS